MEFIYFSIVKLFLFVIAVGLLLTIIVAIWPADEHRSFPQRLGDSVGEHLPMLIGLAGIVVGSYFIYLQFYPDIYACRMNDGSIVHAELNPDESWMKVGNERIPAAKFEKCSPHVVTLGQRIERASADSGRQE